MPSQPLNSPIIHASSPGVASRAAERGVVLVIALILLVVISLLAVTTMRNTGSTESIAGNVRTSALAFQAAEIALGHCERSVGNVITVAGGGAVSYTTTFTATNILPTSTTPQWQGSTVWDSTSTATYVLPLSSVNQTGMTATTYLRPPECMVVPLPVMLSTGVISPTASFIVTARGFGPEVAAADVSRSRPVGSVVWLQSTIEFN